MHLYLIDQRITKEYEKHLKFLKTLQLFELWFALFQYMKKKKDP